MSPNGPPGEPSDDRDRPEVDGLSDVLRRIVDALADAEREGRTDVGGTGRIPGRHFSTEYGFSGHIGPGTGDGDGSGGSDADEYHFSARYDEGADEVVIAGDLPGVDPDDVGVRFDDDSDELVVGVRGRPVERVRLPWPVADVESGFRNGVLQLRIRPDADEADVDGPDTGRPDADGSAADGADGAEGESGSAADDGDGGPGG